MIERGRRKGKAGKGDEGKRRGEEFGLGGGGERECGGKWEPGGRGMGGKENQGGIDHQILWDT